MELIELLYKDIIIFYLYSRGVYAISSFKTGVILVHCNVCMYVYVCLIYYMYV